MGLEDVVRSLGELLQCILQMVQTSAAVHLFTHCTMDHKIMRLMICGGVNGCGWGAHQVDCYALYGVKFLEWY